MKIMLRPFLFLLILASCGSLKSNKFNPDLTVDQILIAVPMTGEGRGRVGMKGQQFVFSFDAVLNERTDWLLSASIPLHGEELMIFPALKDAEPPAQEESFERRIEAMFKQEVKAKTSSEKLIHELRHLIRFMLSAKLNIDRQCAMEDMVYKCSLAKSAGEYTVQEYAGKKITIHKELAPDEILKVEGESFQDKKFMRTNFYFVTNDEKIFSLELIWN